jgi:hypothetical protein
MGRNPRCGVNAPRLHFCRAHPLAEVAERLCDHGDELIGEVACGACWERAIRSDERIVVEHGLPPEVSPDPDYIDEIAVELACRGERVSLTPTEFRVAARRLYAMQLSTVEIARRLHTTYGTANDVIGLSASDSQGAAA